MTDPDKPYSAEGYALMGAAFEVHKEIGGGLAEEIYQQSLQIELSLRSLPYLPKTLLEVYYKNHKLTTNYIPDLLVYSEIVTELKAVSALTPEHEAQLLNYMRIARKPVGYLINFGPIGKLEWKRFVLSEFLKKN